MLDAPQLDKQALAKLNLGNQPFLPPARCEDFFINTALGMLLNGVFQQLNNNNGVQVVKGEAGIGKTSFCHRLLCEVPEGLSIDLHEAKERHTINTLLQTLAGLGEADTDAGTQELAVQAADRVFRQLYNQQQPVLLIDDAHLLRPKTLQTLFKFLSAVAKQGYGRLKLILVGERRIDETLSRIDASLLNPDELFSTLLRPLNRQDIELYIRFRLERAGANQNMPLTKKELTDILSHSGGLPGKINRLTCETLNKRNGNFRGGKPFGKLFLGFAVLAGILAPLVFWLTANRTADSPPFIAQPTNLEIRPDNHSGTEAANRNSVVATTSSAMPGEIETTNIPDNATRDTFGNRMGTNHTETELPAADVRPTPSRELLTQNDILSNPEIVNVIDHPSSESWLAMQPESHHMIQLAGTWNLESLRAYSHRLRLDKTLVFHRSLRNDQAWYVLLYGPFENHSAAQHGIAELPPEVQANNPWVRPVAAFKKSY